MIATATRLSWRYHSRHGADLQDDSSDAKTRDSHVLSIHFTNVTVNLNCFHIFSTEITNYRAYFTVCRIFNERRHFKYVQTNVNMLECCPNGGCRLSTDVGIQCAYARHRPQRWSGGISKRYLLKKHASYSTIGIKRGNSYWKNEEVSGWRAQIYKRARRNLYTDWNMVEGYLYLLWIKN